jgi:pimeloyl-ACP methyl ester carboxylesterase
LNFQRPQQIDNHRFFRKARYGSDRFVLIRQTKFHYVESGKGEPVLLIPGSESSSRIWKRLMPLLEGQYHLLALDYLAIDGSQTLRKLEEAIRQQADLIAQMVSQLKLDKVNLVGGNLGGAVAFNLAARYPDLVERVVGISGLIGGSIEAPRSIAKTPEKVEKSVISKLEEEAKAIQCPILYLYGTNTSPRELTLAHNLKYLQKNHPQAWIVALEGGIFEIALQNPQEITALLVDFFKFKPGLRIG